MVSIVTYADLGKRKNLKTADIKPVIEFFEKEGSLTQVIGRTASSSGDGSVPAVPLCAHYILSGFGKLFSLFNKRNMEERLFDMIVSKRIQASDVSFFHPARFYKTVDTARSQDLIPVGIASRHARVPIGSRRPNVGSTCVDRARLGCLALPSFFALHRLNAEILALVNMFQDLTQLGIQVIF